MKENINYKDLEDKALVKKFLNEKDHLAYSTLYERYFRAIKNFVGPIIKKDASKDDVTQEIFIKVFRRLETYNPAYKFSGWIYRIATNTAIDFIRKERKVNVESIEKSNDDGEAFTIQIPDEGLNPCEVFVLQQREEFLYAILNNLKFKQKKLIVDKFINEVTYKKLSEKLDTTIGKLKSETFRIRGFLRSKHGVQFQENF